MTKEAKIKADFRKTSKWKNFRDYLKKERKVDEITLKPLRSGFAVHHKCLLTKDYTNIKDKSRFSCLNRQTHEVVHWLFRYYQSDPEILTRLKVLLDEMCSLNPSKS